MTKLLGLCGSLRKQSYNRLLMQEAAALYGGAFEEADLNLPLFNEDIETESGIPDSVVHLAEQITQSEAVLIASPEYNQALTGVLKNALDWVSRVEGNPWRDKPVALMSAAAGRTGGARGQYSLRLVMAPFRAKIAAGPEVLIASAYQQFHEDGRLMSDRYKGQLTELIEELKKLRA